MRFSSTIAAFGRLVPVGLLAVALAGCPDDDDGGGDPGPPEERVVYADGTTLHLARYANGALTDVGTASLPAAGLLDGHMIFSFVKHPSQNVLYVTSFNECSSEEFWCWGNGRVDRFSVSKGGISHQGSAFLYDETATDATCAQEPSSYEGQVGYCAPVQGVFAPDGQRFYVQEDDNDLLHIFSVASGGALTLELEGADGGLSQHGLAMHPTQPNLYNGTAVIDVSGDQENVLSPGSGGNYTTFIDPPTGPDLLLTTIGTNTVAFYSLADPDAPVEIDSHTFAAGNSARAVVYDVTRGRAVAVGQNQVATLSFDGATLAELDTHDNHEADVTRQNRSVTLLGDGSVAAVSWFERSDASPSGFVGGVTLFTIATDGSITEGATVDLPGASRVVQAMTLP